MDRASLLAAAAANLAGWHDLQLRSLGHATERDDGWWWTPDDVPGLYLRAIALAPGADPGRIAARLHPASWTGLSDPWGTADPTPYGFLIDGDRPWMHRPAGPLQPGTLPPGVSLERVTDAEGLVALELAAARGFGVTIPEPGAWHGPAQLDDPRQALWVARSGGDAVGTATAFSDAGVVGIYAISTVPPFRRRGIGGALTRAAAAFDPSRPAVLQASEMAIPLYRSIGFDPGGAFRTWVRPPVELPA